MSNTVNQHIISPESIYRGKYAWNEGKNVIPKICRKPLLIGRSNATLGIRNQIHQDLIGLDVEPCFVELEKDCCEYDLKRLEFFYKTNNCDGIIASGGGKVLDAGKLIANRMLCPCITIPLSASTCAGWTALSNIYSSNGSFIRDVELINCPKLLIFDHNFIKSAPPRTLASGIADALAKWYEASITSHDSVDGLVQVALQMSRVLRDQLLIDGLEALRNSDSDNWIRVAEGCALTAGLIGGIGGSKCRTAAAHALHNGLTQLDFTEKSMHGEIVGFGILVQLNLEQKFSKNKLASQSKHQLLGFLRKITLPITINQLGLTGISHQELYDASKFACKEGSEIYNLPFEINPEILMSSIIETDVENKLIIERNSKKASLI